MSVDLANSPEGTLVNDDSTAGTKTFSTEKDAGVSVEKHPAEGGRLDEEATAPAEAPFKTDLHFWAVFLGIVLTILVSALDTAIFATALPTIERDLNAESSNVWVINIFFLTTAAVQPAFGQIADLYGRRWPMIFSTVMFLLGSGICGGAHDLTYLIAGRAVQGIGNGGFNNLGETIISDLVPLGERSKYFGLFFAMMSASASFAPFVGGVLAQHSTWRWIFWLNFPIGGLGLALLLLFLKETRRGPPASIKGLLQIDYVGNAIIIGATISITFALVYGGTVYPWSDGRVIAPLVIGFVAYVVFGLWELSPWCKHPVMPPRLFTNRTATAIYFVTFLGSALLFWVCYFYPFYFQAVQLSTPTRAGVQMLPWALTFPVSCMLLGALLGKIAYYKPFHAVSYGLITLLFGLTALLGPHSNTAAWVFLEVGFAVGFGANLVSLLPAVQTCFSDEKDVAIGISTWAYIRTFGSFWGVTIPAAIFEKKFQDGLGAISDPAVRQQFGGGNAYQLASRFYIAAVPDPAVRAQLVGLYNSSLKWAWYVAALFAGVCFLAVFAERNLRIKGPDAAAPEADAEKENKADVKSAGASSLNSREETDEEQNVVRASN